MVGGDSILDSILDEGHLEGFEDIDMVDVEEGDLVEEQLSREGERNVKDAAEANQESKSKNQRRRKNKKKNKQKSGGGGCQKITDVNRFVLDVCKRLREKKSYLVYTAVGCLGVSALSDLVKEVDVIQACGGQKTSDGRRSRTGGGILWNILKSRDPNAYREIMKKGKEFEKQFKQQRIKRESIPTSADRESQVASDVPIESNGQSNAAENHINETEGFNAGGKRVSVHDRLRVPVSYSDLLLEGENTNNQ